MSNLFQPIAPKDAPKVVERDLHTDVDKYIIEYGVKQRVKMLSDNDDDFVIVDEVVELSRTDRQKYLDSQSSDVGILNIIKKVQLSGDVTLLNQTGRVPVACHEKDSLGRDLEDVVDISNYQVDKIEAFESIKKGTSEISDLPDDLKKGLSFEGIAKMSDDDINLYFSKLAAAAIAAKKGDNENA